MDSAFDAAGKLAEKNYAAFLITRIERMAGKFTQTTVQGTEAPIVVPE